MKTNRLQILKAPLDNGAAGGNAGGQQPQGDMTGLDDLQVQGGQGDDGGHGDGQQQQQQDDQGGQRQQQQGAQAGVLQMTQDQLKDLVASTAQAVTAGGQQGQQGQQQQMTPEEFNRTFNVVQVSEKDVEAIMNPDTTPADRAKALQSLLHNAAKMATTISSYQMALLREEMSKQVAPALQFATSQQEEQLKNDFYKEYPNLKEYEPLLVLIKDQLTQEGKKFTSKQDAFKEVARRAELVIKKFPGAGQGAASNGQSGANGQQRQGMPTLSGGGQSGGRRNVNMTPAEQQVRDLYDN